MAIVSCWTACHAGRRRRATRDKRTRRCLRIARPQLAAVYQRISDTTMLLGRFPVYSFTLPAMARYDHLLSLKLGVGKMDLRIAAVVLVNGGTLVTRNLRDFQQIPGLPLENWAV